MQLLHSAGFVVRAAYEDLALAVTAYEHGMVTNNDGTNCYNLPLFMWKE